jgi:hypothetical protein
MKKSPLCLLLIAASLFGQTAFGQAASAKTKTLSI